METEEEAVKGPDAAGAPAVSPQIQAAMAELAQLAGQLDAIIGRLESGEAGRDESVSLLEDANRAAAESSRCLEQVIQSVVYGEPGGEPGGAGGRDGENG